MDDSTKIRTKNLIRVLPNKEYHFTQPSQLPIRVFWYGADKAYKSYDYFAESTSILIPSDVYYIKVVFEYPTYKNDICINLSDASVNGKYFPYVKRTEDLSIISKYFPNGMRSAGTAHDEIRYNKATQKWEKVQRIGSVDMGSLNWSQPIAVGIFFTYSIKNYKKPTNNAERSDGLLCQHYVGSTNPFAASIDDKAWLRFESDNTIVFRDSTYTDAASFKAAMAGVILYYELAEPIVTEIEDDFNLDYEVWNCGTEKIVPDVPTTPLKADIAYGFNAVGKIKELEERIENLPSAESSVFYAEYGVTTYEEIVEARNKGKEVLCKFNDRIARIVQVMDNVLIYFEVTIGSDSQRLVCYPSNRWDSLYINNSHKIENLADNNVKITIAGQTAEVATPQYVENAIQQSGGGGASSDKQGVVSQTLNYNSADNTYSVSNVVRGSIPSFFIDLVTEAGASFNAESGYFSLNGIDNIAYDEMRQIYDCRTGYGTNSLLAVYGKTYTARTNFVAFRGYKISYSNHEPTTIYTKYLCGRNTSITKFALCGDALCVKAGSGNNFESFGLGSAPLDRSRLEEIIGVLDVTNLTGSNNFFYNGAWHPWLTTFQLKALKASIDLSGMPRLSEATILYMINNEKAASAITIKLHADAKAMADASEAIQSALANHANITLGV